MIVRSDAMREATSALAAHVATPRGRAVLKASGHTGDQPLVPAREDELASVVMRRLHGAGGHPAILAVLRPQRDQVDILQVEKAPASVAPLRTGGQATIGMLVDAVRADRRTTTVRVDADLSLSMLAPI